jgi:ribosomal protein S12 methylthiotransferase
VKRAPADAGRKATRIGIISLGCAKNLVDTEVMLGHLDHAGCVVVQDPQDADVLVVNTCSFIEQAREESIRTILEATEHKARGTVRRVVVAGCMVQRYAGELRDALPDVDAFIGLDELDSVVERVAPQHSGDRLLGIASPRAVPSREPPTWGPARYLYDDRTARRLATPPWTAYIKIAEGCDHTCAFCAIPSFRGTFRSRTTDSIVREARALAREGVREVNLIAQDSSHYGRDRGGHDGLPELLESLDGVEDLRWIRLHYLYPNTVTDGVIEAMARLSRVVNYVDLPLQHAHPATLSRMRRGGSADSHLRLLHKFVAAMPSVAMRTTLIVGFPGETDEEFGALLEFVEAARFDYLGVFTYSHEDGTAAGELDDDVPAAVKDERRARVMELQQRISFERNRRRIGSEVEVVVEGAHQETEHLLVGRMSTQALDVDGQVMINDGVAPPGSFVQVEITDTAGYDLVGRIVGAA